MPCCSLSFNHHLVIQLNLLLSLVSFVLSSFSDLYNLDRALIRDDQKELIEVICKREQPTHLASEIDLKAMVRALRFAFEIGIQMFLWRVI